MSPVLKLREKPQIERGEFWTSKQRQSHSLHYSVSYRASFKPELPEFFMKQYLAEKDSIVLDPFGGRGTTALQANLMGHSAIHNDISSMAVFLGQAKQWIPSVDALERVLFSLNLDLPCPEEENDEDLLHFYHPRTLNELKNFKRIAEADQSPEMQFLRFIALSRLHGHSQGFFSVYSFPQISVPPSAQKRNNEARGLKPDYRSIQPRIMKKLKRDLKNGLPSYYHEASSRNFYSNLESTCLAKLGQNEVDLIVTSPPFLDKVDYDSDNWLRYWFLGISDSDRRPASVFSHLNDWKSFIHSTLKECYQVLKPGAHLVMEVGEVQKGKLVLDLDEFVVEAAKDSGMEWVKTYINVQEFTKLSNCWNVSNNVKGTNSNRCVVLRKI